jgi:beta-hydroxyacyl-ACP dehydratase FabZ
LDIEEIKRILPHREPFLFLDRVEELLPGRRATGFWNVPHDAFWNGSHFPGDPVLPGVLIGEALAQLGGVMILTAQAELQGRSVFLVGIDKIRFRRVVRPGDRLDLEVELQEIRRRMCFFSARATVGKDRVADGSLMATAPGVDG